MPSQNRGVVAHQFGQPLDVLQIEDIATVDLEPNAATIRMIASPINPSDLIPVTGAYRSRTALPFVPGFEGVGVIEAVHAESDQSLLGKRVIPIGSAGGWQKLKTTSLRWCIPVPDDISDLKATTAYINPLTAVRMVEAHTEDSKIRTAVVNAAGSAIARTLAQLLRNKGIRTVGVFRKPKAEHVNSQWDEVVYTSEGTWVEQLRGADLAFDCVGGTDGTKLAESLRYGGRFIHYGLLTGQPLTPQLWENRPDLTIDLFRLRDWVHVAHTHELQSAFDQVFDLIRSGVVDTHIQEELPLEDALRGIELSVTHASEGKIILRP
ncbi:Zn-dependent alcohol dehydrogenase [Corynebacterium suranareeae]|uniref:Zn-dependent alcohol dehydrogenase n=1 Tax=Corynebacterium suranareeae TaxID=2506452 RepID=A0A160PM54_9CORY|nr:zinc-dependent alcohol dehydrogenase family protein [Corynebacterium suranareeae]BAU94314.1 Zn-dependent alcohol dehydrogenase [Corynebacterium suranareeae]